MKKRWKYEKIGGNMKKRVQKREKNMNSEKSQQCEVYKLKFLKP